MGLTVEGKNYLLDAAYNGGAQSSSWYVGLIDGSAVEDAGDLEDLLDDTTDTAASHAGWTEFTGYDEATRQETAIGAAAGGQVLGSGASFTMTAASELAGFFIISNSTKGGSTGTLLRTYLFDEVKSYRGGVVLTITPSFVSQTGTLTTS